MKSVTLQPEQIVVPGEYKLGNNSILQVYFRVFDKGCGGYLPPVLVVKKSLDWKLVDELKSIDKEITLCYNPNGFLKEVGQFYDQSHQQTKQLYDRFHQQTKDTTHYLIDGNHRSAAATLTHCPIQALELESDRDLVEVNSMVKAGELFDFKRVEMRLSDLVYSFEVFCLGRVDNAKTVKKRIDELISNNDLPQYMKERYLRGG